MNAEKIKVRITESGQTIDVVVLNKRSSHIEVVIGEVVKAGQHNTGEQLMCSDLRWHYAG